MLYLEAMGNLQLGNVNNYLQPIISADYSQTTDIRFLAIIATMPTAHTRSAEVFMKKHPIPLLKLKLNSIILDFRDILANFPHENHTVAAKNCSLHNAVGFGTDSRTSFGAFQCYQKGKLSAHDQLLSHDCLEHLRVHLLLSLSPVSFYHHLQFLSRANDFLVESAWCFT
jgi:hypothetical protein